MKTKECLWKIIFIDDETSFVNSLRVAFQEDNIKIYHAKNAINGLNIINKERPDLIITDLIMPKTNGFDLIKKIKTQNNFNNTNIIILTNYGNINVTNDKIFLRSLGITKYLIKSNYTNKQLANEIKNALK